MTNPCRLAVIGAGIMGRHHLTVATRLPEYEIAGVADTTPDALVEMTKKGYAAFSNYREMLDKTKPDAAIVAAPNAFHVPIALECIKRGIAVMIEKPVADTIENGKALCKAVKDSNVPVLVGHHRRHNPLMKRAAEHIASGGIGKVIAAVGLWLRRKPEHYFTTPWKYDANAGGGILLINTIHDFDCLRMLCGDIVSIQAVTSSAARDLPVEDTAAMTVQFASGALGTITVSDATVAPWAWEMTSQEDSRFATIPENSYLVCGSTGSLAVPTLEHWTNEDDADRDAPFVRRRLYYQPAESMAEQLHHFARVVRREVPPFVSADDACRTLACVVATKRSAQSGRAVTIAEVLQ